MHHDTGGFRHPTRVKSQLKHLHFPDGRKFHVVSTPEEALEVQRTLKQLEEDIECVIHGSEEHIQALKELHKHHEEERFALRDKHGQQFDEVETALRRMDELAAELKAVSEHAEQFDASHYRFGYSNKIKSTNSRNDSLPPMFPDPSSYRSNQETSLSAEEWEKERFNAMSIKFFVKPVVRQYEHKGFLWRNPSLQTVTPYELFIDLLYVGLLGVAGDQASEEASGHTFLRFAITYLMGWKIWSELTLFMAWFDAEDILRRITVLFTLSCLVGFTTNLEGFYEDTYTAMLSFYLTIAFSRAAYQLWYSYIISMIRGTLVSVAIITFLAAAFWIGSIHTESESTRQILIWIALFIDIIGYEMLRVLGKIMVQVSAFRPWLAKHYEFIPGISIEHRVDRIGGFVMLVFGYSVVSLLFQNRAEIPLNAFLGKAILSLVQVFNLSSIYFEMDNFNLYLHAIRRHPISSVVWTFAHIPFTMGFVLSGSALSRLVIAHDSINADPGSLYPAYEERSEEHITDGQRWFYCVGLGVALLCTVIISLSHVYKKPRTLRYNKHLRLILRTVIAILMMLLPLITSLNALELISTTTGLTSMALFSDLIGNMLTNHYHSHSWSDLRHFGKQWCDGKHSTRHHQPPAVKVDVIGNKEKPKEKTKEVSPTPESV